MRSGPRMGLRRLRDEPCGARLAHEPREPGGLFARQLPPARRDAVVAAADVVVAGIGPLVELLDKAVIQQTLDRSVERRGPEPEAAVGPRRDVLHDGVAVALAVG